MNNKNKTVHIAFITNGNNNQMIIDSIFIYNNIVKPKDYSIKFYVIGNLNNNEEIINQVNYLHFTEHDNKGWITKKKNLAKQLILENSISDEDISMILADDLYPTTNVLVKTKEILIDNQKDFIAPKIIKDLDKPNRRTFDWATIGGPAGHRLLCFYDYDAKGYIDGSTLIFRTILSDSFEWDENLFLNQMEDVKLSRELMFRFDIEPSKDVIFYGPKQNWPVYQKPHRCIFSEDCKCVI